jgi:hypothetical protein
MKADPYPISIEPKKAEQALDIITAWKEGKVKLIGYRLDKTTFEVVLQFEWVEKE